MCVYFWDLSFVKVVRMRFCRHQKLRTFPVIELLHFYSTISSSCQTQRCQSSVITVSFRLQQDVWQIDSSRLFGNPERPGAWRRADANEGSLTLNYNRKCLSVSTNQTRGGRERERGKSGEYKIQAWPHFLRPTSDETVNVGFTFFEQDSVLRQLLLKWWLLLDTIVPFHLSVLFTIPREREREKKGGWFVDNKTIRPSILFYSTPFSLWIMANSPDSFIGSIMLTSSWLASWFRNRLLGPFLLFFSFLSLFFFNDHHSAQKILLTLEPKWVRHFDVHIIKFPLLTTCVHTNTYFGCLLIFARLANESSFT